MRQILEVILMPWGIFRVLTIWIATCAAVLSGRPGPIEFHSRTWNTDDGLPHNSVKIVLQDALGFMWFATAAGLARFDGHVIREVPLPRELRTGRLNIRGMAEERPGVLLVVSASEKILRLEDGNFSVHPATEAVRKMKDIPMGVHATPSGVIWVSTASGRLLRWSRDGTSRSWGNDRRMAPPSRPLTFAPALNGETWIIGDNIWLSDARGEIDKVPSVVEEMRIIAPGRHNRIWAWTGRRMICLEGGNVVESHDGPDDNVGVVRHLFEDRDGAVWIATSRLGVLRLADGEMQRVGAYSAASFVTQDNEGSIWVATDGAGIGQLREKNFRLINSQSGLQQDVVSALCEDSVGRLWVANRSGGLAWIGADGVCHASGLLGSNFFANVVCADAEDRIWFGGGRNGLSRWRPGQGEPVRMAEPAENVHLLFKAKDGAIWFAAQVNRLGLYYGDTLRQFTDADGFPPQEIRAIAQDDSGDIWLGGRSGELLRWNGEKFMRLSLPGTPPDTPIHSLYADEGGRLWIATSSGLLVREAGDVFHRITEEHGLADDIVQDMLEDGRGDSWFTSRRGLFRVRTSDLLAVCHDPTFRFESHRIGPNEGLPAISPTTNYYPTACRRQNGSLWFACAQGALSPSPEHLARSLPGPKVLIDEIRVDGRPVPHNGSLKIPSEATRVEFRLAALSYIAPEKVALRHRLDGADSDWHDAGVDRVASYMHLAPGKYRLEAIAKNSSGVWSATAVEVGFEIVPAWWETSLFRACASVVGLVILIWSARKFAHRRLRRRLRDFERKDALQKERIRIARDLHDDLGAGLTEIGLIADRLGRGAPPELVSGMAGLSRRIRILNTDVSGVVWAMNSSSTSLADLIGFLRRYAARLFKNTGVRFSASGTDPIPPTRLPHGVHHHVLAAVREALANILKHAGASEVRLDFRLDRDALVAQVSDNGAGFDVADGSSREGNGLRNIRSRMHELGGDAQIHSTPGQGTRVVLNVPLGNPSTPFIRSWKPE